MRHHSKKGITLIEMVVIIVVISLAIPSLMTMWANVAWRSSKQEALADGLFYAQELLEEVRSKRFDENTASPWTSSGALGSDDTESPGDSTSFDDIDDYTNTSDESIIAPSGQYKRSVKVEYVSLDGAGAWQPCALPVNCISAAGCSDCNYKKVTVIVGRQDNLINNATVTTIISAN